ncbi:hypothetical protein ACOMHN_035103 [Nucella lapillus]
METTPVTWRRPQSDTWRRPQSDNRGFLPHPLRHVLHGPTRGYHAVKGLRILPSLSIKGDSISGCLHPLHPNPTADMRETGENGGEEERVG